MRNIIQNTPKHSTLLRCCKMQADNIHLNIFLTRAWRTRVRPRLSFPPVFHTISTSVLLIFSFRYGPHHFSLLCADVRVHLRCGTGCNCRGHTPCLFDRAFAAGFAASDALSSLRHFVPQTPQQQHPQTPANGGSSGHRSVGSAGVGTACPSLPAPSCLRQGTAAGAHSAF